MLSEKYKPKKIKEIIGQDECVNEIVNWLKNWKPGSKAILFHGPAGSGKTSLVQAIAKEKKLDLIELNASDYRTAEQIENVIGHASRQSSLFNRGKIILIDEIDGISGEDRGGVAAIIKIIRNSKFPIMITANDAWDMKLRGLHAVSTLIKFKKIPWNVIAKKLNDVAKNENLKISQDAIRKVALNSSGDMRSALNDLEIAAAQESDFQPDARDRESNIFEAVRTIFKTKTASTARHAIDNVDENPENVFWWIENNICNEYKDASEIASAFEKLSKADIFMKRISRNQNWLLLGYAIDLMTSGVAVSKKNSYSGFTSYKPPQLLLMMARTKQKRVIRKEICLRIGKKLHESSKTIKTEYLPYLRIMLKENPKISDWLELSPEEVDFVVSN